METMVISPDLEVNLNLHKKAWPGKHVRQKQQTSHKTSCWALCCHAYIAYITWLLSYCKLFLCYFRQGFHRFWKHFGSWNFGKWPIIVLAFSVGKKEKSANFWMNFSLKMSHLWVIIILGDQKLPPRHTHMSKEKKKKLTLKHTTWTSTDCPKHKSE